MKKTTKSLALARTTIAVLSSTNLAQIAGGRWQDPRASDDGYCWSQPRNCNTQSEPNTHGCASQLC